MDSASSPTSPVVVDIDDVHVEFNGRPILRGVSTRIRAGETLVILGGSGCGKSTLLRTIIGSVVPCQGRVEVLGKSFADLSPAQLDEHRCRIGILFQSGALFQSMTVGENIACVLREHYPLTEEEIDIMVTMKLEMVGLRRAKDLYPSEISGGMRKRVALARTLSLDPEVMLYDEPGAGLDPVTLAGVDRLIETLGKVLGMASVVVTHRMESALNIAHRMIFLHNGRVLVEGTPEELQESKNPYLRQFLAGSCEGPIGESNDDDDYAAALLGSEILS